MNLVKEEALKLLKPILVLSLLLYGVFALFGKYQLNTAISILIGSTYAIINFLMIGRSMSEAMRKPPEKAQAHIIISYLIRYILTGEIIYLSFKIPYFNTLAVVLPMFFPKLILVGASIFRKKGG